MYIKDLYAISAQLTHNLEFEKGKFTEHTTQYYLSIEPDYMKFIPASKLRRMGRVVKMGVGAALPVMERNPELDGFVLSTANGGLEDCVKFLEQIIKYNEGVLTPTNFVQSTPNALAGQLSILSKNTGYNITHVNGSFAFENALLDSMMFIEEKRKSTVNLLVGAVEEFSDYHFNIESYSGRFKEKSVPNSLLLDSNTPGTVCGEGATMFCLSNQAEGALAEIIDVSIMSSAEIEDLHTLLNQMFTKHQLTVDDISFLVLGNSGDLLTDDCYTQFRGLFPVNIPYTHYKHFVGEYKTSTAFATYLTVQLMNNRLKLENSKKLMTDSQSNYAIIYNQTDKLHHSLILMKK